MSSNHLSPWNSRDEMTNISTPWNTRAEMTNDPSPWYTRTEMVEWDADFMRWSMMEMIPCMDQPTWWATSRVNGVRCWWWTSKIQIELDDVLFYVRGFKNVISIWRVLYLIEMMLATSDRIWSHDVQKIRTDLRHCVGRTVDFGCPPP